MGESFSLDEKPFILDIDAMGQIQVQGVVSVLGMSQSNPVAGNDQHLVDISNAQAIIQKNTGLVQFYIQGGAYSTPSLGTSYQRANRQTVDSFGFIPLASISLAPNDHWKFTAGKINSFGGYEDTFTFQNINIDRGLLWNQTSNVSKGFEATYKNGPVSTSITLNDGFYSNQLSWMGASIDYQLNETSNTRLVWTGAIKASSTNNFITPVLQNNSQIFNAIYTYKSNRWSITPYLQYTYIPANPSFGILTSAQTTGVAVLGSYRFSNDGTKGFVLPLRFEYIGSSGKGNPNSPNLLYGPGSAAWSATITPTYQFDRLFVRVELSLVKALNATAGQVFGSNGSATIQTRAMLEVGALF